ncbi:MAG: hypothetical protein HY900_36070, partial [Deltaproteobacteria bacterium]|nr:hypothetical protein [Deltaproteobacteria bacterium]
MSEGHFRIFYSWQSDLPNSTNRGFIDTALHEAAKRIREDDSIEIEPVVDRDTQGLPGSPDIARAIFDKIDQADLLVCDVSIVRQAEGGRPCPNPNVLIELGYGLKALGHARIVLVSNLAFGPLEQLPFDLRMRRAMTYEMPEEATSRAEVRRKLSASLEDAIRAVLQGGLRTK